MTNTLKITSDISPESPREWENLGKMVCFHTMYKLGDEHAYSPDDYKKACRDKGKIVLPLYLYDHSGLSLSTSPFPCRWDSGHVGWIEAEKSRIRLEWQVKRVDKKLHDSIVRSLEEEVKVYNSYLNGEVYNYMIEDEDGDIIDSCGGFFGTDWENNGMADELPNDVKDQLLDIEIQYS